MPEGGGYGSLQLSACMGFMWDVIIQKVSDANRAYTAGPTVTY